MKHGVAFRKFSRTSSHRMLMLRNLVTSLFEHERIKTTLPKARDTARLAEKIITMGKKGTAGSESQASSFLLKPTALNKLLETYAKRYADRPGGYTRILKLGNRKGDHAPAAVLELVDNPKDLRFEMTARAAGWDIVQHQLHNQRLGAVMKTGAQNAEDILKAAQQGESTVLRPQTAMNVQKLLKFRGPEALVEMSEKAKEHADRLLATPLALKTMYEAKKEKNQRNPPPRPIAGMKQVGETRSVLDLARGRLGHARAPPAKLLTMSTAFNGKYKQQITHP
ncbi:ribosomal protein L17 [Coprinopsis cinerea okayama7|uniref:Ribosomal protein L17 n=1 Tax=Coprinopsis cinerea (strain Okayama-7 / 130 / ATCC MYA-4618 / FGSC 9003) TaxID=240176 RepID=A8N1L7_COPC7|nr:mitochondrial 54S ribosomal protein YmL8 [Coprinopsis cinerea okayama7\|eukprot:XP_001828790.1 mitochondrial 54S ribosomal protein YmL8 [Coprinopsis cinerea okayama7\